MADEAAAKKELTRIRKLPENRICPNCNKEELGGFQAVCMAYKIFVCSECKSAHQSFSHRCKSVAMSTWKMEEVKVLDERNGGGNRTCRETWLARCAESGHPEPDGRSSMDAVKRFVDRAYNNREWYDEGGGGGRSHHDDSGGGRRSDGERRRKGRDDDCDPGDRNSGERTRGNRDRGDRDRDDRDRDRRDRDHDRDRDHRDRDRESRDREHRDGHRDRDRDRGHREHPDHDPLAPDGDSRPRDRDNNHRDRNHDRDPFAPDEDSRPRDRGNSHRDRDREGGRSGRHKDHKERDRDGGRDRSSTKDSGRGEDFFDPSGSSTKHSKGRCDDLFDPNGSSTKNGVARGDTDLFDPTGSSAKFGRSDDSFDPSAGSKSAVQRDQGFMDPNSGQNRGGLDQFNGGGAFGGSFDPFASPPANNVPWAVQTAAPTPAASSFAPPIDPTNPWASAAAPAATMGGVQQQPQQQQQQAPLLPIDSSNPWASASVDNFDPLASHAPPAPVGGGPQNMPGNGFNSQFQVPNPMQQQNMMRANLPMQPHQPQQQGFFNPNSGGGAWPPQANNGMMMGNNSTPQFMGGGCGPQYSQMGQQQAPPYAASPSVQQASPVSAVDLFDPFR